MPREQGLDNQKVTDLPDSIKVIYYNTRLLIEQADIVAKVEKITYPGTLANQRLEAD